MDGAVHSTYLVVCETARQRSVNGEEHPWLKYTKRDGRWKFQLDLAHELIGKGILMDQPDVEKLKDKSKRPSYMRKMEFHPCGCGVCFFCKNNITHGVQHKEWRMRSYEPSSPPVARLPPSRHPKKRQPIGTTSDCKVCVEREKEKYKGEKSLTELREMQRRGKPIIARVPLGCGLCGVRVCKSCWDGGYKDTHHLSS